MCDNAGKIIFADPPYWYKDPFKEGKRACYPMAVYFYNIIGCSIG
jgi:hypothetical protein